MSGRFAPSPTGDLHLGNLRTAAIGWLAAKASRLDHVIRMEDLDRVQASVEHEVSQLADLATLGITSDVEVIRQSDRFDLYDAAIADLTDRGLTYECFCSRREVRAEIEASPSAPHLPPGAYPGTCRDLSEAERSALRDEGRRPALRLRAPDEQDPIEFGDLVCGHQSGGVDDTVLRRNDGVPSYNVAVVIDDAAQGVTQVVRGDDLLDSVPRQIHLQRLLGLPTPSYAHVPLVFGEDGERLAKRHGSVTLGELRAAGIEPQTVLEWIVGSFPADAVSGRADLPGAGSLADVVPYFRIGAMSSPPVVAPSWI